MRHGLVLLACVALLGGCARPDHRAIIGTWKSDAERTLASMNEVGGIPADVRAAFENDFYGHLVVEYRENTVRAFFDNRDYDSGYQPYQVIEVTEDYIITREWNEVLGRFESSTTFLEGDCIFGLSAEFRFREYFCRLRQ